MTKRLILVFTGLFGSLLSAAPLAVRPHQQSVIHVQDETVRTQTDLVAVGTQGRLEKTGGGEWIIPDTSLIASGPTDSGPIDLAVYEGRLTLTTGASQPAAPEAPSDILAQAALWLDAAQNVVVSNGEDSTSHVLAWHDARETKTSAPFDHPYAETKTNLYPLVQTDEQNNTMLYFRGYKSGCWMNFMATQPDAAPLALTPVKHSFIVYRALDSYCYPLGNGYQAPGSQIAPLQPYHPGTSQATLADAISTANTTVNAHTLSARNWLNGQPVDFTQSHLKTGLSLIEHSFSHPFDELGPFATVSCLANGWHSGRQGGDGFCEVIVFTNKLDEAARVSVENYLMKKYQLSYTTPPCTVGVAAGASVKITENTTVSVTGNGQVLKTGPGQAVLQDPKDVREFSGTLTIEEGSVLLQDDATLHAQAGTRLHVGRVFTGNQASFHATDPDGADIPDTTFEKSGMGDARLTTVPDTVSRLNVRAGVLTLAAPSSRANVPAYESENLIQDGSFESYTGTGFTVAKETPKTCGGWTYGRLADDTTDSYALIWNALKGQNSWDLYQMAAEGACVMIFRGASFAATDVTIPADGTYELSFEVLGRNSNTRCPALDVFFSPQGGDPVKRTRAVCFTTKQFVPYRLRLPNVKAGKYRLEFRSIWGSTQHCPILDNVKLRRTTAEPSVHPVPNGDFEQVANFPLDYQPSTKTVNTNNLAAGWHFTPSVHVGLALPGVLNQNQASFQRPVDHWKGSIQLFLSSTDVEARTMFRVPRPGRYRLRGELGRWYADKYNSIEMLASPVLHAVIQTPARDIPLGTVQTTLQTLTRHVWPQAFTVEEADQPVTLILSNSVYNAALMLDNLELVYDDNLLQNGGFEKNDNWTLSAPLKNENNSSPFFYCNSLMRSFGNTPEFYGYARCEGSRYLQMTDRAFATQTVTFPEAGWYCLRFRSSQRVDSRNADVNIKGLCPVRAWIARDGVTNVIGRTVASSTNYVGHAWHFNVPDASTPWTFGFEAANDVTAKNKDRTVHLDNASIEKIPAPSAETPDLPKNLELAVSEEGSLCLAYSGTNRVKRLTLDGVSTIGTVSAATHPQYITGNGTLLVEPDATVIFLR
jgi:hypothetical protein